MNKLKNIRHTLYEIEMKIIQLEFKARSKGLKKNEEAELEVLKKKQAQMEGRL
ncbi:MAG TPA: hypothetical protein P5550_00870 [Bacteroidales bacterium]|nr:hypothetical protein [Bacteroidales bacterium]